MKIDRTSWHYRLISFYATKEVPSYSYSQVSAYRETGISFQWEPVTTCQYYQRLIPALIATLIFSPFFLLWGAGMMLAAALAVPVTWIGSKLPEGRSKAEKEADNYRKEVVRVKEKAEKRTGLIQIYREGRGHRMCNLIEYE